MRVAEYANRSGLAKASMLGGRFVVRSENIWQHMRKLSVGRSILHPLIGVCWGLLSQGCSSAFAQEEWTLTYLGEESVTFIRTDAVGQGTGWFVVVSRLSQTDQAQYGTLLVSDQYLRFADCDDRLIGHTEIIVRSQPEDRVIVETEVPLEMLEIQPETRGAADLAWLCEGAQRGSQSALPWRRAMMFAEVYLRTPEERRQRLLESEVILSDGQNK